jgi:D-alanyl-D-alanine carboxypeptidase
MKKFNYLFIVCLFVTFFVGNTAIAEKFDINGDDKTGIAEAIFALKTAAGYEPSIEEKVQNFLDFACKEYSLPGLSMAIIDKNQETALFTSGESDKINNTKMTPKTQFRVGSVTKTFTAMTILQLAQEGKLFLTQTVEFWLPGVVPSPPDPEPENYTGYNANDMTIRHLLNHTSGLDNFTNDESWLIDYLFHQDKTFTPQELVEIAVSHPPVHYPDELIWYYSNTGYVLMGMIVEKATGNSWENEVRSRFINPLGLSDTFVPETGETNFFGEFAHGYIDMGEQTPPFTVSGILEDCSFREPSHVFSSGNIISTPENLARWIKAIGDGELLNEQYQNLILSDAIVVYPFLSMGLGVVHHTALGYIQHSGQIGGYDCGAFYHLDTHLSVGLCTNRTLLEGAKIHNVVLYDVLDILGLPEEIPTKKKRIHEETNKTPGGRLTEY